MEITFLYEVKFHIDTNTRNLYIKHQRPLDLETSWGVYSQWYKRINTSVISLKDIKTLRCVSGKMMGCFSDNKRCLVSNCSKGGSQQQEVTHDYCFICDLKYANLCSWLAKKNNISDIYVFVLLFRACLHVIFYDSVQVWRWKPSSSITESYLQKPNLLMHEFICSESWSEKKLWRNVIVQEPR